jgi:hypothetical protein
LIDIRPEVLIFLRIDRKHVLVNNTFNIKVFRRSSDILCDPLSLSNSLLLSEDPMVQSLKNKREKSTWREGLL